MNIATWSGPRNLSTAMMYAFGARADCAVWDEPFYPAFLAETGIDHPLRDQVLSSGETDPARIAAACVRPPSSGEQYFYQKHMTHHMVPKFDRGWLGDMDRHVFLIRHPARVLASYVRKREAPTLEDIGFVQQTELFDLLQGHATAPVVIDSSDIRAAPEAALGALCARLGIPFDPAMLSWAPGGHPDDGIWAAHWYDAVHRSTGFAGPEGPAPEVPDHLQPIYLAALPHYDRLKAQAMRVPQEASDD